MLFFYMKSRQKGFTICDFCGSVNTKFLSGEESKVDYH